MTDINHYQLMTLDEVLALTRMSKSNLYRKMFPLVIKRWWSGSGQNGNCS